jgi:microcystin degradation protein MlrC
MTRKFVLGLVKHETNTFSPIDTPLSSFGHGEGPASGEKARARFEHTNTPLAAYLDLARRESAEIVIPIAAEAWPSNKASRATFETLVRPLEDAVRAGCDAVFLDLHGAMVIEDCDDAEGEIVQRLRRIAPKVPIAVTLDYHTNLSGALVDNATVISGYKTYPHVDMYEAGMLSGGILIGALDGVIEPVMAWGWKPMIASVMRHAPEDGPSGDILDFARRMESDGTVLAATLLPSFPHADTPYTGVSAVVVGDAKHGGRAHAQAVCTHMLKTAWDRRDEYVFRAPPLAESVAYAKSLGLANPGAPVLLIDHCDNCGSGGAQDVMTVVAEVLKQELDDVAIAPIRDPAAVAAMIDAGVGQNVRVALGGHTDMPSIGLKGEPLMVEGRVLTVTDGKFVVTGPMYTGVHMHLGRTAVLDTGRAQIVVTERAHEPFDLGVFTHAGIDPRKKRHVMLKSRIHYRAGFKPIAAHIVECAGAGVTNADLSVYPYRKLTRPIFPLDPM